MNALERKLELLSKVAELEEAPGLRHDLQALAERMQHSMRDILAKLPGDSLAARARSIGVSRQTMYMWLNEKLRPSADRAQAIAELTGVPSAHIRAVYGEDDSAE